MDKNMGCLGQCRVHVECLTSVMSCRSWAQLTYVVVELDEEVCGTQSLWKWDGKFTRQAECFSINQLGSTKCKLRSTDDKAMDQLVLWHISAAFSIRFRRSIMPLVCGW
jgi:hypothetical protein